MNGEKVLQVVVQLPGKSGGDVRAEIAGHRGFPSATLYEGAGIKDYVLPRGVTPPAARGSKSLAAAGTVICRNVPARDSWKYGTKVTISVQNLRFENGEFKSTAPVTLEVSAYPP